MGFSSKSVVTVDHSLKTGLTNSWEFNNSWLDDTGSNDGSATGAIFDSTNKKLGSHSVYCDGSDDVVDMDGFETITTTGDFSISLWFRRETTVSNGYVLVIANTDNSDYILIGLSGGKVFGWIKGGGSGTDYLVGSTPLSINTWYHAILTYKNSTDTAEIFINNTSEASDNTPAIGDFTGATPHNLDIGCFKASSDWWKGQADNVHIWNKVLSSDERAYLYNSGTGREKSEWSTTTTKNGSNAMTHSTGGMA